MVRHLIALFLIAGTLTVTSMLVGPGKSVAQGPPQQVVVKVKGAGCPFCVFGIEKWFSKIDGVDDVEMDLETGKATLTLKPGAKVTEAELNEAIKKAGFTPAAIEGNTYKKRGD